MGAIVPRRSFCGSGAFVQNRPRSSLDYKIGWFRKWVVLQAGKWGQMRHVWPRTKIPRKKFPRKKFPRKKFPRKKIPAEEIRPEKMQQHFSPRAKNAAWKFSREKISPNKKYWDENLQQLSEEVKICSNCPSTCVFFRKRMTFFRGLWKGGFQGPFSVVSRSDFPRNAYFFKKFKKKKIKIFFEFFFEFFLNFFWIF